MPAGPVVLHRLVVRGNSFNLGRSAAEYEATDMDHLDASLLCNRERGETDEEVATLCSACLFRSFARGPLLETASRAPAENRPVTVSVGSRYHVVRSNPKPSLWQCKSPNCHR